MKNQKRIEWVKPVLKFNRHFGYDCQIPQNAKIDSENDFDEFSRLIDKCIADDFDYTIKNMELYRPRILTCLIF